MITKEQAVNSLYYLASARDTALLMYHDPCEFYAKDLARKFGEAAEQLGFTLTPIQPDMPAEGIAP